MRRIHRFHTAALATATALSVALLSACTIGDVSGNNEAENAPLGAEEESAPQPTLPESAPAPAPATTEELPVIEATDPQEALESIAADNPGTGIAVAGGGGGFAAGMTDPVAAWSTAKVPLAIAAERAGVAEDNTVTQAITYSDNAAADSLWEALGGGQDAARATQAVIGAVTVPATPPREGFSSFGQTQWSVAQQAKFVSSLGCMDGAEPVLAAMGQPDPAQNYGLGSLEGAVKKGGWGPATDGSYEARQMGLVTLGGHTVAVALYASADSGDYGDAQQMLTRLAAQLESSEVEWPAAGCQQGAV